jgi:hypothetical protein
MIAAAGVEAAPLLGIALRPGGTAALAKLLGWGSAPIAPLAWLLAAAVAMIYAALSMASLPFIRHHALDRHALKLLAIPFALVTGTFEELFFRQMIMNALLAHGSGLLVQIVLSGLAFGAAHAVWGVLGGNMVAALKAMAFTTCLGVALAVVYLIAGRQLAPAAWSHIAINLIIEPWLVLAVINLKPTPPNTV